MKILLIDNYDSFTYNLFHYISKFKKNVEVFRNDKIDGKIIDRPNINVSSSNKILLDKKIIDYCMVNLNRDLHYLIATIDALDEWSLKTKRPITIPLLKQLLV